MVNDIKIDVLDWHKHKVVTAPSRGNRVLVSYTVNLKEAYGSVNQTKTRCVWPGSLLNNDTKYLSRKVSARAF